MWTNCLACVSVINLCFQVYFLLWRTAFRYCCRSVCLLVFSLYLDKLGTCVYLVWLWSGLFVYVCMLHDTALWVDVWSPNLPCVCTSGRQRTMLAGLPLLPTLVLIWCLAQRFCPYLMTRGRLCPFMTRGVAKCSDSKPKQERLKEGAGFMQPWFTVWNTQTVITCYSETPSWKLCKNNPFNALIHWFSYNWKSGTSRNH